MRNNSAFQDHISNIAQTIKTDIRNIVSVQRTYSISDVMHLNYWERLGHLKQYSLERRRERYMYVCL